MLIRRIKRYDFVENKEHTTYRNKDGEVVPSVTEIIKSIPNDKLMSWANGLGWRKKTLEKELEDSSSVGTLIHESVEAYIFDKTNSNIFDKLDSLPMYLYDQVINGINSFKKWYTENKEKIKPIECEISMAGDSYGGTTDLLCEYNNKLCLVDFKTSADIHPSMFIQLGAYKNLYENIYNKKIENLYILRLDKKTGNMAELISINDTTDDLSFDELCDLYYWIFENILNVYTGIYQLNNDFEKYKEHRHANKLQRKIQSDSSNS